MFLTLRLAIRLCTLSFYSRGPFVGQEAGSYIPATLSNSGDRKSSQVLTAPGHSINSLYTSRRRTPVKNKHVLPAHDTKTNFLGCKLKNVRVFIFRFFFSIPLQFASESNVSHSRPDVCVGRGGGANVPEIGNKLNKGDVLMERL